MGNLNLLVFLNAYSDTTPSNDPSLNNFKWSRSLNSLPIENTLSYPLSLAPGETRTLFNGSRTLAQDGTTEYSIALKPLNTSIYVLSAVSGTLPAFRSARTTGADATTQITVTINGPVATFTSTSGTALNLAGCQVGDSVFVGNLFNIANQGLAKIISLTTTSFSIQNLLAVAEGPITLGSGFAAQIQIFGATGVQAGDNLVISGGFSPVTQGTYQITAVYANSLEFCSLGILPMEGPITTQAIAIYSQAKQFVYLESDQSCSMIINNVAAGNVSPFVISNSTQPGIFMRTDTIYSMSVTNNSTNTANLYLAAVE